jgi:hypothetical protein
MTVLGSREELADAGQDLLSAMAAFTSALRRAGGRESDDRQVRHFAAYHLADLEGNDDGGSWLATGLMADELRRLVSGESDEEDES